MSILMVALTYVGVRMTTIKLCFSLSAIDTTSHAVFGEYGQNLFILYRKENIFEKN